MKARMVILQLLLWYSLEFYFGFYPDGLAHGHSLTLNLAYFLLYVPFLLILSFCHWFIMRRRRAAYWNDRPYLQANVVSHLLHRRKAAAASL